MEVVVDAVVEDVEVDHQVADPQLVVEEAEEMVVEGMEVGEVVAEVVEMGEEAVVAAAGVRKEMPSTNLFKNIKIDCKLDQFS